MKLGHGQGFRLFFFKPTNTLNSYQNFFFLICTNYWPVFWYLMAINVKENIEFPESRSRDTISNLCFRITVNHILSPLDTPGPYVLKCWRATTLHWALTPIIYHALWEPMNSTHHLLTRDPTATKLPLWNFSQLYSWRQICCRNWRVPKCIAISLFGILVDCVSIMLLPLTSD